MTWTRSSPMPTASSCSCAARSSLPARPTRSAPTRACARPISARPAPPPRSGRGGAVAPADARLLDARGLSAFYGRAQVLFGVSLALRAGEVVALLGRNGAGKSTTLKAVMGLVAREAERLVFAGRPIARCANYKIARLGLGY